MKQEFIPKNFGTTALTVISQANQIMREYSSDGLDLTLRQLYYQFVATDAFPDAWGVTLPGGQVTKNHERNYKKLGKLINDARLAGLVSWESIVDRTRSLTSWQYQTSPEAAVRRAARNYCLDPWATQDVRVELWIEKEALAGVFETPAMKWGCPYFSCRGYFSQSSAWEALKRVNANTDDGKKTIILHFGDHDPSGIDMSFDIERRFQTFLGDFWEDEVEVRRMALNLDQVRAFNPPPSPAKITDSRAKGYIEEFGEDSWELDALNPKSLQKLAGDEIASLIDQEAWDEWEEKQDTDRERMRKVAGMLECGEI